MGRCMFAAVAGQHDVMSALGPNTLYARDLGRALAGAALFALPLFMTMEMWAFGFTMDRGRLLVMLIAAMPILVGLSYFAGFERAFGLVDHVLDTFAAIAVAAFSALCVLMLFGVLQWGAPVGEVAGKVAVLTLPGAIGALLAHKQLDDDESAADAKARSYFAKLFLMAIGAIFIAFNVAPTEEMILIAHQISPWQAIGIALISLAALHALLFLAELPGRAERRGDDSFFSVFIRYSLAGYGICAAVCAGMLRCFGRLDGVSIFEASEFVIVLGFPAALGAGAAQFLIGEKRGA